MSLEHIFRNLNDIRVFDVMSDFVGESGAIDIDDILDILDYPQREIIQIEDSVSHLTSQQVLSLILIPEETSTGCALCKMTDENNLPRHKNHEDHVPAKTEMLNMPKYYMPNNVLTTALIATVMANSFNSAEEIQKK